MRWKNRYVKLDRPQILIAPYVLSKKTGICNRSGLRYTLRLIFWVRNQVPTISQTFLPYIFIKSALDRHCAQHFRWENRNHWVNKSQILVKSCIFGGKIDIYDWLSLDYTLQLIFWVKNQISVIGQAFLPYIFVRLASNTCCA